MLRKTHRHRRSPFGLVNIQTAKICQRFFFAATAQHRHDTNAQPRNRLARLAVQSLVQIANLLEHFRPRVLRQLGKHRQRRRRIILARRNQFLAFVERQIGEEVAREVFDVTSQAVTTLDAADLLQVAEHDQLVLRLPSGGDPRRIRRNLQLFDVGNIRIPTGGSAHAAASGGFKYASSFTNSRFIIGSRVGYSRKICWLSVDTSVGAIFPRISDKLHHSQQIEVIRIAKLAPLLARLDHVAAQYRFAPRQYPVRHLGRRVSSQKPGSTLQKRPWRLWSKALAPANPSPAFSPTRDEPRTPRTDPYQPTGPRAPARAHQFHDARSTRTQSGEPRHPYRPAGSQAVRSAHHPNGRP